MFRAQGSHGNDCFWYRVVTVIQKLQCVVPENIHIPPTESFLVWTPHPSRNSMLVSVGLFKPPSPLEFPLTFLGVGMDIFWNYTIYCWFSSQQSVYMASHVKKRYKMWPYVIKKHLGGGNFSYCFQNSLWSPDFFQASSFQLLKLENLLQWSLFTFICNCSTNMNYFIWASHVFKTVSPFWRTSHCF